MAGEEEGGMAVVVVWFAGEDGGGVATGTAYLAAAEAAVAVGIKNEIKLAGAGTEAGVGVAATGARPFILSVSGRRGFLFPATYQAEQYHIRGKFS
jgi:hypothetical protein